MPGERIIACVDVDYRGSHAVAAGLWFTDWFTAAPVEQLHITLTNIAPYESGSFYRRELPCLLALLERGPRCDVVIVDGYVWLADDIPGLGAHLHSAVGGIVIGVAKTRYAGNTDAIAVTRGSAKTPLFVSAIGITADEAATIIQKMHGPFRIPTLLKAVDGLARTAPLDSTFVA